MPGGKRTDRISERDLEVLEFVVRFGVVPRDAVGLWANTRRAATLGRERRLREAGLLQVFPAFGSDGPFLLCTRRGLRAVARDELRPSYFAAARARHAAVVARVAAELELAGEGLLSEREIAVREQDERERLYSAELSGGRYHRPDLVLAGKKPIAMEIELSQKGGQRLDEILRGWRRAVVLKKVGAVIYRCAPQARGPLERSIARTRISEKYVRIEELQDGRR
jgi:hypothetical protein